jgi:hypothetical protein
MTFIPIIGALITGLLGWLIARLNIRSDEKKQERKRLRRLLYNMLELKSWVDKVISAEMFTDSYADKMLVAIGVRYPEKQQEELVEMKDILSPLLKKMILDQPQNPWLEQNINEIIREFSEIDPFFAYDLTGKYQLNEMLERIKNSVSNLVAEAESAPQASLFLDHLLRPVMMVELQRDLKIHLPQIAKLIDKKTLAIVQSKYLDTEVLNNDAALESYCNEMLPRLFTSIDQFSELKLS